MSKRVTDRVFESDLIKHLMESVTVEEREDFKRWVEENLSPLDEIVIGISDMLSTEKSSEELFDAINEGVLRSKVGDKDVD